MIDLTINLTGWTKVHTWREGHGNGHDDIYQCNTRRFGGPVMLLTVCTRHGQPTSIRTDCSTHDYLMAKAIRTNLNGRYVQAGDRTIEACCTAGYEDWSDTQTDDVWRLVSVAGHGEYAYGL